MSAREAATEESVKRALERVVHLPLDVFSDEGSILGERFHLGSYFPLFILTDEVGNPIDRWAGYINADQFLERFNRVMRDLSTVETRVRRMQTNPNLTDAITLARYHADAGQYATSVEYYKQAQAISGNSATDFGYQIFNSAVNASWTEEIPFGDVLPYADSVLMSDRTTSMELVNLAKMMANLARKTGNTSLIAAYLSAGIRALGTPTTEQQRSDAADLQADYALHIEHDTAAALKIKKTGLGMGWERDVARYYAFGEFCFMRGINLAEAEKYIRQATDKATGDKFIAKHLRLLSEICFAQGKKAEAIAVGERALALDASAAYFEKRLDEMKKD